MGMRSFKVLKDYIKKGLVDILDRDGCYNRGCSVRSEEDRTNARSLKSAQRPSDMQSFIQSVEDQSESQVSHQRQSLRPGAA
mgnify:CR=1 FL=1